MPLDFLAPPSHPELLGRLGRYEIERVIGAGGMGLVLKGFDGELHRPVAIKVMRRIWRIAQRLANVLLAKALSNRRRDSPACDPDSQCPSRAISALPGDELYQWFVVAMACRYAWPLSIEEDIAHRYADAAGMRAAHETGLIHRDVIAGHILLEEGTLRVVLSILDGPYDGRCQA